MQRRVAFRVKFWATRAIHHEDAKTMQNSPWLSERTLDDAGLSCCRRRRRRLPFYTCASLDRLPAFQFICPRPTCAVTPACAGLGCNIRRSICRKLQCVASARLERLASAQYAVVRASSAATLRLGARWRVGTSCAATPCSARWRFF